MPKGNPAGYLPNAKASSKDKGAKKKKKMKRKKGVNPFAAASYLMK